MKKILCFTSYPAQAPSVYHRIKCYAPLFQSHNIDLGIISFMTPEFFARRRRFGWRHQCYKIVMLFYCTCRLLCLLPAARKADLVIIHREVFPLGPPWIEYLIIQLAKKSVYDLDDAIWFPPSNSVNQRAWFSDSHRVSKIMKRVDAVIAGSPYIADYARDYNPHVHIIPTTYDDTLAELGKTHAPNKESLSPTAILWIGNWGNAFYLESILPTLASIAKQHPIELIALGGDDVFSLNCYDLVIRPIRWSREAERDWLVRADIGIMPLNALQYEQGKCAFKLIQYFSAGLPVIASPVGMNNTLVRAENGYLAHTPKAWFSALEALLSSASHRQQLGQTAYEDFKKKYTRPIGFEKWLAIFTALTSDSKPNPKLNQAAA